MGKSENWGHALSGLLGALVGGGLSLAGVGLTIEAQTRQYEEERHRESYVQVLSAAENYRVSLEQYQVAMEKDDSAGMVEADAESWDHAAQVYAANIEAELALSNDEMKKLQQLMDVLFHGSLTIDERLEEIPPAMIEFANQGRKQFGGEALPPTVTQSPADTSTG